MARFIRYKDSESSVVPATNYSMEFDGFSQRMFQPNPNQITGAISFSGWFKSLDPTDRDQTIVAFYDGNPGSKISTWPWHIFLTESGKLMFLLAHSAFNTSFTLSTTSNLNDGEWHHFACTFNDGVSRTSNMIYIDGVHDATSLDGPPGILQFPFPTFGLTIGMVAFVKPFNNSYFHGFIDEIAIWDGYVLTPADVAAIYAGGADMDLNPFNPKYWWRMGENAIFHSPNWKVPSEGVSGEMISENMILSNRTIDVP